MEDTQPVKPGPYRAASKLPPVGVAVNWFTGMGWCAATAVNGCWVPVHKPALLFPISPYDLWEPLPTPEVSDA